MLRMDHPDVFQSIFTKYKIKMGHWSSRSVAVSSNKPENSVEIIPTQESSSQITWPSHPKNYYQSMHSPRFIEEKLKSISNLGEDKRQYNIENKKIPPLNQPQNEVFSPNISDDQKLKLNTSESENKFGRLHLTKIESNSSNPKRLQKLLFDPNDLMLNKINVKEKRKQTSKIPSINADLMTEENNVNNLTVILHDFFKKTVLTSPRRKEETDFSSKTSSYFLPYERDAEKLKLKGLVNPLRSLEQKKKASQVNTQIQLEGYNSFIFNEQHTERFDITGSPILKDFSPHQSKNMQTSMDYISDEKPPIKKSFRTNNIKKKGNLSVFDKSIFKSDYSSVENSLTPKILKHQMPFNSPGRNTQKLFKVDTSTEKQENSPSVTSALRPSAFPLFSNKETENKTKNFQNKLFNFDEYTEVASDAERTFPKLKNKKSTMISSKHNLFRMKPKKEFLEYRHYLTSIQSKDQLFI